MIFYTADLHFHYEPFLPSRPFDTVEDMDRQLIHRWNEAVSEEDTVYVVGDVGYNRGLVPGDALSRLRGHKHLIPPPPPPQRRVGDGWLPGRPDFRPLPSRPDSDKE